MGKTFRPYEPDQLVLMPVVLQEWLPADHLAYFISDVVDQLDLASMMSRYEEERGYPPYHPRMMVKVLVYAYCIGGVLIPPDGEASSRGYRLPGAGRQQHP